MSKQYRRRLSAATITGALAASAFLSTAGGSPADAAGAAACTDTSAKGGAISPCMMIARANNWIAHQVPYNQGGWYASPSGDGTYREDCAGFVAMAWHMKWSPPVTYSPPGLDDPSISKYLGTVASLRSAGHLSTIQPGDALALTGEHIVLFAGWTDSSHTTAVIDSESHPGAPTGQDLWSASYLADQGYKAYRYNLNQNNPPATAPTVTIDSGMVNGGTYGNTPISVTGTATPAADAFYFHIQQNGVDKAYSPAVPGTPGTPHHTWQFNPATLPNGAYQVFAAATLSGAIGTSTPITITINNGPVAPAAPVITVPSGVLAGTAALTASAPGAASVTYSVDGTVIGTSTSGPDFSLEWNTVQVQPGQHTLTAVAANSGGTSARSTPVAVTVAPHSSPSIAALPGGGFQAAWHGADTQNRGGSLWLATGTGTTMNGPAADPNVLGVAPGTSPSIVTQPDGSWVAAWHGADTDNPGGSLWLATGTGTTVTSQSEPNKLGVAAGTSPALTTLPNGGWALAWHGADTQSPNGSLWLATGTGTTMNGPAANPNVLGLAPGTSPSIIAQPDGSWVTAWHGADTDNLAGSLWLATGTGTTVTSQSEPNKLGVAAGTSPVLTTLPNGGWALAWHGADTQSPNGSLWLATGTGTTMNGPAANPNVLGLAPGTSPSIIAQPDGSWVTAWHGADTDNPGGSLWLATGTGTTISAQSEPNKLGIAAGTSPALTLLPNGDWEAAWDGADSNNNLWLATGTGTTMNGPAADPYQLGVA